MNRESIACISRCCDLVLTLLLIFLRLVDSLTDKEQCWDLNKQKSRSPNVKHLPLPPGKAIVIFANGDKYVGGLQNAQKEGDGMCSWL